MMHAGSGWRIGPGADARRVRLWLFVSFALLYALTMHGRTFADSRYHFEQIETFIETGLFVMWPASDPAEPPGRLDAWSAEGLDGNTYSLLPPGLALTATPLALVGRALDYPNLSTGSPGVKNPAMMFWASLTLPLAMAAMLVAIYQMAFSATGLVSRGLQAALVVGLATNTWFYATTFWTRPLAAACLVGGLAVMLQAADRAPRWMLAGALLGWALVVRPDMVFALPWLIGLAAWRTWGRWHLMGALLLPIVATVIGLMLWNQHRFGDLLSTGSPHQTSLHYKLSYMRSGLPRILFGAKDGLFRYVPVLIFTVIAIPAAWRRQRDVLIVCVGASAALILFYASYLWGVSAPPIAWGSRHLYPVVPLLLIPAFLMREHAPLSAWWAKALVAISIPLQLQGLWQRAAFGPPIWWLARPGHAVFAATMAALLLVALWRLLAALDVRRASDGTA